MQLPTVRIAVDPTPENPLGYVVINESDFDSAAMKRWPAEPEPAPAPAPAPEPAKSASDKAAKPDKKAE